MAYAAGSQDRNVVPVFQDDETALGHHKNQCGTVSRGPAAFNRMSRASDSYLEGTTSLQMIGARTQLLIDPEQIPVLELMTGNVAIPSSIDRNGPKFYRRAFVLTKKSLLIILGRG
jgi:hypothetical protein